MRPRSNAFSFGLILWLRQKSRIQWLKLGDSNSHFLAKDCVNGLCTNLPKKGVDWAIRVGEGVEVSKFVDSLKSLL
jgi:hypothetical protein